jgi:hypothetical protein
MKEIKQILHQIPLFLCHQGYFTDIESVRVFATLILLLETIIATVFVEIIA